MSLGITVLGSGSRGNAVLVHTPTEGILIDSGFTCKEMLARMAVVQVAPEIIRGLLITHEHTDHIRGMRRLAAQLEIPTYLSAATYRYLEAAGQTGPKNVLFEAGTEFRIGAFAVQSFPVPHDAIEPVGFIISYQGDKIGVATDLGTVNRLIQQRLHDCTVLMLESNHDLEMLKTSERPLNLKRRIMGKHGHLNNDDALASLGELLTARTRVLFLSHLSEECNCAQLLLNIAREKLAELNRNDILLQIALQAKPLPTVWLSR